MQITLVFPHQLFRNSPALAKDRRVLCVEEPLFFRQYAFHQQKLAYHRTTIQHYADDLRRRGFTVDVVEATSPHADARLLGNYCRTLGVSQVHYCDPVDDWLGRRLTASLRAADVRPVTYESPMFINTTAELTDYFATKSRMHQTDFYVHQRKRLRLLIDQQGKPVGGKWSFDAENRKKYPKAKRPPAVLYPDASKHQQAANQYVAQHFSSHYGTVGQGFNYPVTPEQSSQWLDQFLNERFQEFGAYEDAIVLREPVLHHSLLTPMLNIGLITPMEVVQRAVDYSQEFDVPLSSLEGFVRQIVGWREFIRAVYVLKGREQRTRNYWGFKRPIPKQFWSAETGIAPLDAVIGKVLKSGYCHHIERLMVVGNFMLLCEFDPDEVYRWFMELFIDAYDWVMVPNVYGMSQFADGGLMSTKPYISGSNYILKMSDSPKGDWQEIWDALFWRFMHVHRQFFLQNPRLGMLIRTYDAMPASRQQALLSRAEAYLA